QYPSNHGVLPSPCPAVTPSPVRGAARGGARGALIGGILGKAGRGGALWAAFGGGRRGVRRGSACRGGACYLGFPRRTGHGARRLPLCPRQRHVINPTRVALLLDCTAAAPHALLAQQKPLPVIGFSASRRPARQLRRVAGTGSVGGRFFQ